MTDDEKTTKIEELRKRLASGRVTTASEDLDRHSERSNRTYGGGLQALFGEGTGVRGNERDAESDTAESRDHERSSDEESIRKRSSFVRLSDNHSSANGVATEARSSSRFVADDAIPKRIFQEDANETLHQDTKDSQGKTGTSQAKGNRRTQGRATQSRSAKGSTSGREGAVSSSGESEPTGNKGRLKVGPGWKLPSLADVAGTGKGKTLNSKEADSLREGFREALADDFEYVDQFLRTRTGDQSLQIWSDVDNEELDKVTEVFLRSAQRSPVMATVVRETINTHDYIVTGMVFLPRLQQTVKVLRDARKVQGKRPSRWQNLAQSRQQAGVNGNAQ